MPSGNSNNSDIMHVTNLAAGNINVSGDITAANDRSLDAMERLLDKVDSIDKSLATMSGQVRGYGTIPSQSAARDYYQDTRSKKGKFGRDYEEGTWSKAKSVKSATRRSYQGFLDSFEDALIDGLIGSDFKKQIKSTMRSFADQLGTEIEGIPDEIGKQLGQKAMDAFRNSDVGKQVFGKLDTYKKNASDYLQNKGQSFIQNLKNSDTSKGSEAINKFFSNYKFEGSGYNFKSFKNVAQQMVKDGSSGLGKIGSGLKDAATSIFGRGAGSAATSAAGQAAASGTASAAGAGSAAAGAGAASAAATSSAAMTAASTTAASGMAAAGTEAAEASAAFPPLLVVVAAGVVVFKALKTIVGSVGLAFKSLKIMIDAFKKAGNRNQESREKNVKLANERMQADIETMVRKPFEILQQAAEAWYSTWDNQLKTISATQGYTKSDVQDLMSAFTQRLRSEGLTDYISGADLTNNLSKVLESGLSGKIAEEFAYQATKLNAAVPTQDFFNYASTYASVAANAVRSGMSEAAAIQSANESLSSFTSGLLYASRELSGGFTTGLKDAASVYEQAVKIAQASRTGSITDISSVLLAVRGEVGAVAPDLATSITDTIYNMLTGGNSSDTVALRSLAGVNASNTEFLRAVAKNPQKVFSTLFENLAKMYNDSSDAYMEKAEGYAQLFGLTSEAFQRINFNDLANAISKMNMSNASLNENMNLLVDGQTTTSAEQLKNQQINKYMIEEGLSLVLDNEAGRAIQEHMWQEQIARELQEAMYAVELKGAAAEALEKLKNAVNNILNFLNPFSWLKKIGNVIATSNEAAAQEADVRQLLELGKVGQGNATSMYQLTTRNANLNIVDDLVTMMGGVSLYGAAKTGTRVWNAIANGPLVLMDNADNLLNAGLSALTNGGGSSSGPRSQYNWGSVGKSVAKAVTSALSSGQYPIELPTVTVKSGQSAASSSAAAVKTSIDKMLADDYLVDQFVKQGKSYDEWAATASKFNISDLNKAIEDAGYSQADIEQYFQDKETEQGVEEAQAIRLHEKLFRDTGISFWTEKFPDEFRDPMFEYMDAANSYLKDIEKNQVDWKNYFKSEWINKGWPAFVSSGSGSNGLFNKFYIEFMRYFVNHYYYSNTSGYDYSDVDAIQRKSKEQERGDTVYALAEMLTKNLLDLKDPTVQTNALLAQILIVVNAIMNQQNEVAGTTGQGQLLESLSAMALGMTTSGTQSSDTSTII